MKLLSITVIVLSAAFSIAAQDIKLSATQISELKVVKANLEKLAAPAAIGLAQTAKKIYANMLSDKEDQKLRKKLNRDLHLYAGQLLDIKGRSFRETLAVLTAEQKHLVLAELQKPDAPGDLSEVVEKVFGLNAK